MPRELQMNAAPVDAMLECAWFWGINMGAPADQDDDSLIVPCGNQVENQKHCDNLTTAFGGSQNPAPLRQPSDPLPLPEALHITNPANAFYVGTFDFSMSMSPAFGPFSMDVPPKETLAGVGAEELQCQAELLEHSDSGIPDSCGKDVLDKRILDSVSSKGTVRQSAPYTVLRSRSTQSQYAVANSAARRDPRGRKYLPKGRYFTKDSPTPTGGREYLPKGRYFKKDSPTPTGGYEYHPMG
eukprot:gene19113-25719_t